MVEPCLLYGLSQGLVLNTACVRRGPLLSHVRLDTASVVAGNSRLYAVPGMCHFLLKALVEVEVGEV